MKAKQSIWYYDHFSRKIEQGVLISPEDQSNRDDLPTFHVRTRGGFTSRVLQNWVFDNKEEANKEFKRIIRNKISQLKLEIKGLEGLL